MRSLMSYRCYLTRAPMCLVLALVLAGCGPSGPTRVAVRGTVRYKGEMGKEGSIVFRSVDPNGTSAGSPIGKDGSWSIPAEKGLLPGNYVVQISLHRQNANSGGTFRPGGGMLQAEELLPEEYNTKSQLTRDQGGGSQHH